MKRRTAVTAAALGVAGLAALRGGPMLRRHAPAGSRAGRAFETGRQAIKRRADGIGLAAYVAAMKRGLPERDVVLGAYRATANGQRIDHF